MAKVGCLLVNPYRNIVKKTPKQPTKKERNTTPPKKKTQPKTTTHTHLLPLSSEITNNFFLIVCV